ncbi:unnamed protein product [Vitrella brassicaformis CCMP3155]|uniref:Uncharacterized protein n=1 Tax=Vitrella brassicaformis (strain CCMP3155) TaxID=1169540 RepID=A0A0G4EIB3_VITBC|nr:unnamed protein product [Vitrella brassicaformis CCMP3155]|eukprot:CEL95983.1 unnamed protein product [Vitrella brassicaformis CCMP3155]
MKETSRRLGAEYLSVAPSTRQHSYPPKGVLHQGTHRLCVNLVCHFRDSPINVLFVVDTTAVWSYLTKEARVLLHPDLDNTAPCFFMGIDHLPIECAQSFGDWEHINILGTNAMAKLGWSPLVDWGRGSFVMAPVSIGRRRWRPGVWAGWDGEGLQVAAREPLTSSSALSSAAADVKPPTGQVLHREEKVTSFDGPPEGKARHPHEYAVKLPDMAEKEMEAISRDLGAEYLSVAPSERQHSYPPEGVLHVDTYRLCVNLVCRWDPLKGGFGKPINVLFVIDTTAVWSYLSKKAMAALLEKPIDSDALPSNLTVRIEDHLGKEHLIECAPSFGDFEHINILGTQAMGRLGWSPVVVEWGDWGMFIMAPVSIVTFY